MLTEHQTHFFNGFKGFSHQASEKPSSVFKRLAKDRCWPVDSGTFRNLWLECIGSEYTKGEAGKTKADGKSEKATSSLLGNNKPTKTGATINNGVSLKPASVEPTKDNIISPNTDKVAASSTQTESKTKNKMKKDKMKLKMQDATASDKLKQINETGKAVVVSGEKSKLTEGNLDLLLSNLSIGDSTSSDAKSRAVVTPSASSSHHDEGVPIRYFDKYSTFTTDKTAPIAKEFARLAQEKGWNQESKRYSVEFGKCCVQEFEFFHGTGHKLEAWQQVCIDLGLTPPPKSINKCKNALEGHHVNIYDYIDSKRAGTTIKVFTSLTKFRAYTKDGKIFSKKAAKENQLLKVLLERVFH